MESVGLRTSANPPRNSAPSSRVKLPVVLLLGLRESHYGVERTNTGTEVNDALRAACERGMLEPLFPIVVRAQKAMARDVFEFRDLGQRTLEFLER